MFGFWYMAIFLTLSPIYHWAYSSQYMKTYFLTSGIVKKAHLLLEKYRSLVDQEYESNSSLEVFLKKNRSIEMEMSNEAARSKRIKRIFLLLDIAVSVSIPVTMKFLINALGEDYVS